MPISLTVFPFGSSLPWNFNNCRDTTMPVSSAIFSLIAAIVSDGLTSTVCAFPSGVSTVILMDFGSKSSTESALIPYSSAVLLSSMSSSPFMKSFWCFAGRPNSCLSIWRLMSERYWVGSTINLICFPSIVLTVTGILKGSTKSFDPSCIPRSSSVLSLSSKFFPPNFNNCRSGLIPQSSAIASLMLAIVSVVSSSNLKVFPSDVSTVIWMVSGSSLSSSSGSSSNSRHFIMTSYKLRSAMTSQKRWTCVL